PRLKQFPPFGKIYAVRYGSITRDVYDPPFKNCVMVDFSTGTKSNNLKVSKNSIHICGIRQVDEGFELARLIVAAAERAHEALCALAALPHRDALLDYIAAATQGPMVPIPQYTFEPEPGRE